MEVDVELDDELVAKARRYSGLSDLSALANEALRELIAREEQRRDHCQAQDELANE